jgi:hypothetical protein
LKTPEDHARDNFINFWRKAELGTAAAAETALVEISLEPLLQLIGTQDRSPFTENILATARLHTNGFLKLTLPGSGHRDMNLRLHIWNGEDVPDASETDAHNHRWSFASRVLTGSLVHFRLLAESIRDGEYRHYRHTFNGVTPEPSLTYAGDSNLYIITKENILLNSVYHVSSEIVHRVSAAPGIDSATLVLEQTPRRLTTNIYAQQHQRLAKTTVAARCDPESTRSALMLLLR